ncbi:BppU family phage baseplate upper protein, partial [Enterococcus faecium]|uniref:BppU family phage baseplate upper protein n=1 Tax=Enterococcus faecium TaxID=1352 RepID=UPI00118400BA
MVYKMNESIIVIQAEATSPNRTNVVFWSHDRGTAKLRMKLVRKNGIPQSLPEGTTVPIRLMFKSATAEGGYGKHDYLATIEDPVNGIVSIVLEDNILGYVGTVEGSVYIDFPNDRSLDTAGRFTFSIKRSPIDDSTPELEDYYFNGFSQTIDRIEKILADGKQEIEQKIEESETQIDVKIKDTNDKITKANQDVATLNTNIDKANDRIDQTNQQIGDLGKLKKMYSNSLDFGDYDYSGNPNLIPPISFASLGRVNNKTDTNIP